MVFFIMLNKYIFYVYVGFCMFIMSIYDYFNKKNGFLKWISIINYYKISIRFIYMFINDIKYLKGLVYNIINKFRLNICLRIVL